VTYATVFASVIALRLAIELRRKQPHHMHPHLAAIARKLAHCVAVALGLRQFRGERAAAEALSDLRQISTVL
jgi:hypothetical protein